MPLSRPARLGSGPAEEGQHIARAEERQTRCCTPRTCLKPGVLIDLHEPEDSVRLVCNNEQCNYGPFMHRVCFEEWEESVLAFLRSCGRARSWSEKQRMQNLWTKKGYDLAFKACDCRCGKGHLRKDLDGSAQHPTQQEEKKLRRSKKKTDRHAVVLTAPGAYARPLPTPMRSLAYGAATSSMPVPMGVRPHASSFSSTGSSPPHSASPPPSSADDEPLAAASAVACSPASQRLRHFSFSSTGEAKHTYAITGNIFCHRENLSVFNCLPPQKRNGYHIKMEDEGPFVNDETRCFVLSNLSAHRSATVQCVICLGNLVVYDRYPLIDGTFFLTPTRHQGSSSVVVAAVAANGPLEQPQTNGRPQYMAAVCMHCLLGWTALRCRGCRRRWDGGALVLGTMYAYDVFAAQPCCQWRLLCRSCRRMAIEPSRLPQYYSEYSRPVACQHCHAVSEHFVQSVTDAFYLG